MIDLATAMFVGGSALTFATSERAAWRAGMYGESPSPLLIASSLAGGMLALSGGAVAMDTTVALVLALLVSCLVLSGAIDAYASLASRQSAGNTGVPSP